MDDNSIYVISSDRGQILGQLQFNYRRRYSSEIGIISDAIREWGNLVAAAGFNRYTDSINYSHTGFICCLAWARVTKLIEETTADDIQQSYFKYFRDCEVLSHIPFNSEMFQYQYDSDIACFEYRYRKEGIETDSRLETVATLAKRLTWYYEIPKENRLYEHADFEGLYDRDIRGFCVNSELMKNYKYMNDIKLLALDIDGTILTREKKLTERTRAAIESAADSGIAIALVTGRPFHGIPDELMSLKGLGYVISSNGAVMTDLKRNICLQTANLDPESAMEIICLLRALDLVYAAFVDGVGYCELEPFNRHLGLIDNPGIETYIRKSRRITYDMEGVIRSAKNGVENIWFIAHDQTERDELNREIKKKWTVRTVLTGKVDVEIGSLNADKGLALSKLAEILSIDKSGIMAIGDNDNDVGMLRAAGTAVAMGNADDEVKRIADIITGDNNADGAAKVIEQLLCAR